MEADKNNFSDIYGTRHRSKGKAQEEMGYEDAWVFYGSKLSSYETDFKEIMPRPLKAEADRIREKGLPVYACDIMGPGQALRDLSPNKGLAITLADGRFYEDLKKDEDKNIDLITGDVLSKKTREMIDEWVKQNTNGQGFNIALARPLDGLNYLTNKPDVWYGLINYFWAKLDKRGGVLYTQLPVSYGNIPEWEKVKEWVEQLKRTLYIDSAYFPGEFSREGETNRRPALRLEKKENSPDNLPKL